MSAFIAPAVNAQDLINRILQLKQITEKLEEQNCKLKDYNKQLETQVIIISSTRQQKKKDKVKVNPPEPFKNMKGKELNSDKNKVIMAVSYLYEAVFDWFNIYLWNYYEKDEDNQNDDNLTAKTL
ncbi:uncharacterized protein CIMG_12912 [Coccidioides immitis RS]|uniref:Uncharacterized protein n=1 Tax=Coccidioides immitis (strain RS) TaxID=246410 RepID=A0A0D8JVT0_COCIM|nr:uncharacterized protein CIMG_12912 [Coccidioides immitis RS]KJF60388.1 hypothetical protein CIMG_12912 [Coccidioides immitis RS]